MGSILSAPPVAPAPHVVAAADKDAPDWDAILDQAHPAAPHERLVRVGAWFVATGMHVNLADVLRRTKAAYAEVKGDSMRGFKLLVLADTVDARHDASNTIRCDGAECMVAMGRRLLANATLRSRQASPPMLQPEPPTGAGVAFPSPG